jgi:hypothetical protein
VPFSLWIHATVGNEITEPHIFSGEPERCENMFVERPAGGAIEILAGGFEGADGVRRGDSGDELLTPLPCPENIASFLKNTGVMQCSATGCDV